MGLNKFAYLQVPSPNAAYVCIVPLHIRTSAWKKLLHCAKWTHLAQTLIKITQHATHLVQTVAFAKEAGKTDTLKLEHHSLKNKESRELGNYSPQNHSCRKKKPTLYPLKNNHHLQVRTASYLCLQSQKLVVWWFQNCFIHTFGELWILKASSWSSRNEATHWRSQT